MIDKLHNWVSSSLRIHCTWSLEILQWEQRAHARCCLSVLDELTRSILTTAQALRTWEPRLTGEESERLRTVPQITKLIRGRARTWTQAVRPQRLPAYPHHPPASLDRTPPGGCLFSGSTQEWFCLECSPASNHPLSLSSGHIPLPPRVFLTPLLSP